MITSEDNSKFWELCAQSTNSRKNFFCLISRIQGKPCDLCNKKTEVKPNIEIIKKRILKQPLIIIPVPSPRCNEKWNYEGHGDDWECDCKEGISQSPINLITTQVEKLYNKTIFDFLTLEKDDKGNPLKIEYEDHIIKLKGNFGNMITFNFIKFEIYEVQFHIRSEHSIDGKFYDLEVQIYYRAITPGYIRKSAAVSILYKITPGSTNLFFDKDLNILDLPDETEKIKTLKNSINLKNLFLSDSEDSYEGFNYYLYEGSVTQPPCNEETSWYVVSTPIPISYTAVEYFKDSLRKIKDDVNKDCFKLDVTLSEEYTDNIRNIQSINHRQIYYYEGYCHLNKKKPEKPLLGHYEKMKEQVTRYFYVNDDKPTGIPNAFVVSESEAKYNFLP